MWKDTSLLGSSKEYKNFGSKTDYKIMKVAVFIQIFRVYHPFTIFLRYNSRIGIIVPLQKQRVADFKH